MANEIQTRSRSQKEHDPGREKPLGPASSEVKTMQSLSLERITEDDPRVIAALEVYLKDLDAGRLCPRDEFLARHAEIADVLDECLAPIDFIHGAAAQLGGQQSVSSADPAHTLEPCAQLGDYRILREIGRGGMGVVYEAEQVSLGRHVALKVLLFAAAIDPKQRQRFQIESQAAAQLHHPHIVPIFSVGCDRGIHYYVMQFVEGRSLAGVLRELRQANESSARRDRPSALGASETTVPATAVGVARRRCNTQCGAGTKRGRAGSAGARRRRARFESELGFFVWQPVLGVYGARGDAPGSGFLPTTSPDWALRRPTHSTTHMAWGSSIAISSRPTS